jgi:hypothetical protein
MSNFDLKKYLAEGNLFKEIKAKAPYIVPEGWDEIEDLPDFDPNDNDYWEDDPDRVFYQEVLKAWEAPMEGWDTEHMDRVMIKKEYDFNPETGEFESEGKFYVDGYVAFGSFIVKGPFNTFEEAFSIAIEEMEAFKEEWDDKGWGDEN